MCASDLNAYVWLHQVIQVALVWDHVADGDAVDKQAFESAMRAVVTEWPMNPFLRKHADYVIPTAAASISAWKNNDSRDLHYSVYREIPCAVAFVLGGNPLVDKFMPKISELVKKMREEDDKRDAQDS
jgi:hypothetical protein